jgi:hypothetical protein
VGSEGGRTGAGGLSAIGGSFGSGGFGSGGFGGHFGSGDFGGRFGGFSCPNDGNGQTLTNLTADLVFVVGRDLSMRTPFGDSNRMEAVQTAISGVVAANPKAVRFGYVEFPSVASCSNACCPSADYTFPTLSPMNDLSDQLLRCDSGPPQPGCVSAADSRPVAQALQTTENLFDHSTLNDKYVILLVDGSPGCPGETRACDAALQAASTLSQIPVNLYVVAIGDEAQNNACLKSIAMFGPNAMAPYVVALDPKSLDSSLDQLVSQMTAGSCTIELSSPPLNKSLISVVVNGSEIPNDPSMRDGWAWLGDNSRRIQIFGRRCADLRNSRKAEVRSGCPPCGGVMNTPCH